MKTDRIEYIYHFGGYCECCDCMITEENASPDSGLCIDCYAETLVDNQDESTVREYLKYNFEDFVCFLRGDL